jgi:transcriptional regulator with XRE-family HTH domain
MRTALLKQFGGRLAERIRQAGFTNISDLLVKLGLGMTFVSKISNGSVREAGVTKLARIAVILGVKPSELLAEIDDLLLDPDPVDEELFQALDLPGKIEDYDTNRLAIVVDVVLGWREETGIKDAKGRTPDLIASLYDDFVTSRRNIRHLELRRLVTAAVFGIELPEPEAKPRGRGRPPNSAAA